MLGCNRPMSLLWTRHHKSSLDNRAWYNMTPAGGGGGGGGGGGLGLVV